MVRIISIALTVLFAASSIIATPVARTVPQIVADIHRIGAQVTKLEVEVEDFPNFGGTLVSALAVHNDALALAGYLDFMNVHVVATGHPPESDARVILDQVRDLVPLFRDCLVKVVNKRAAFQTVPVGFGIPIPSLIKTDLNLLKSRGETVAKSLVRNAPPDLVDAATNIESDLAREFIIAINAYADA